MITPSEFDKIQEEIRSVCSSFDDKGKDFENIVSKLLKELGFFNVNGNVPVRSLVETSQLIVLIAEQAFINTGIWSAKTKKI